MPTKATAKVWSNEERAAMAESARERKTSAKLSPADLRAQGEADLRAAIEKMPPDEQAMTERLHVIVTSAAPSLAPKTYYGMPGYANADGKIVVFIQPASKFKTRYSTLGFEAPARLDDGDMWATAFALIAWTPETEKRIAALVKAAVA